MEASPIAPGIQGIAYNTFEEGKQKKARRKPLSETVANVEARTAQVERAVARVEARTSESCRCYFHANHLSLACAGFICGIGSTLLTINLIATSYLGLGCDYYCGVMRIVAIGTLIGGGLQLIGSIGYACAKKPV
jgi:hypothetical protein